jgi:hypothetical protein
VVNRLCSRMIPEETVPPAANYDNLGQPRIERLNKFAQAFEVGVVKFVGNGDPLYAAV